MTLESARRDPTVIERYPAYRGERRIGVHCSVGEGPFAVVVLLHGGEFGAGSPGAVAPAAQALAERLASIVATPDYTLTAEGAFPAAAEDAYAALLWAQGRAAEWCKAGGALLVIGIEAGGNLAAVTAMMARDRGGPPLAAQILIQPMLDPSLSTRSMRCSAEGVSRRCDAAYRAYLPSGTDRMHPYAAPLASVRLAGLPPALILTSHDDPLRDEAEAYAAKLIRAGVTTQVSQLPRIETEGRWGAGMLDAIAAFAGPRIARPRPSPRN
jgi:acetyl esterase/lipase